MTTVAVLVPVLDRPHRVAPLVESLRAIPAPRGFNLEALFICSPGDQAEIDAVRAQGLDPLVVSWEPGDGDYARKMNRGFAEAVGLGARFVFLGADDLVFQHAWLANALSVQQHTRACVVGTNDLANRRVMVGQHSTHTLVHCDYGECGTIDEPGQLLHEGYSHNFVDDEFVQTAMARWTWAFARGSHVQHLHPDWGTAEMDATYRKGKARFNDDRLLFESRRPMWLTRR